MKIKMMVLIVLAGVSLGSPVMAANCKGTATYRNPYYNDVSIYQFEFTMDQTTRLKNVKGTVTHVPGGVFTLKNGGGEKIDSTKGILWFSGSYTALDLNFNTGRVEKISQIGNLPFAPNHSSFGCQ